MSLIWWLYSILLSTSNIFLQQKMFYGELISGTYLPSVTSGKLKVHASDNVLQSVEDQSITIVAYNGYTYSTLAQVLVDGNSQLCQANFISIPGTTIIMIKF